MNSRLTAMVVLLALALLAPTATVAFESEQTFAKGTLVLSGEGGYGSQLDLEDNRDFSAIEFWDAGVRFGFLPFETIGKGSPLYGALEVGFGPLYQRYVAPERRFWAGLSAIARYHFLAVGRVVPYVELAGSAGGTDLRLPEIRSSFAFLIFGGAGASVFFTDKAAAYAGYRWQHVSNGNTSRPNRGFESNVAVLGLSLFF
jgi:predicted porin